MSAVVAAGMSAVVAAGMSVVPNYCYTRTVSTFGSLARPVCHCFRGKWEKGAAVGRS